jgi:hypothetical protein
VTEPPEPTYAPTTEGGYEYPTAAPPDAPTAPEYEPGTRIPVRLDSRVYTLPVERLKDAQALGAVPMTEQEWGDHQAKLMAERQAAIEREQYGHISNQFTAAGVGALESVPGLGPAAIAAIGHATGGTDYMRKSAEWNHIPHGLGVAAGIVIPAILSDGATAVEEGAAQGLARGAVEAGGVAAERAAVGAGETIAGQTPEALAEAARLTTAKGVGASPIVGAAHEAAQATQAAQAATPGAAKLAGQVFSAPQNLVTRVGEGVENWVAKQLPAEAQSIAGKLALKAAALGARGAGEGAIYGANDYAAQQALSADPEFDAEKLMAEIGHGMLLGGATGGLLGAGGELASQAIGKAAPLVGEAADHQLFRSVFGKGRTAADVRDVESIAGGWRGVVQAMREKGAIQAGDDISAISGRLEPLATEAGEKVGALSDQLDAAGIAGPRVGTIKGAFDEGILDDLLKNPNMNAAQVNKIADIKNDLAIMATRGGRGIQGIDEAAAFLRTDAGKAAQEKLSSVDMAKLAGGEVPEALKTAAADEARLTFAEAREFRRKLAGKVTWNRVPGTGAIDETGLLFRKAQGIVEDEIQKAAENGAAGAQGKFGSTGEKLVAEDWVDRYRAAKLEYQRLKVASRAATKGAQAKLSQAQVGLAGYAGLVPGAVIGAVHGSLPGALMGLASGVAAKTVKERGAATAGVLLDRLSTLGALQHVSARGDMKIAKGAKAILSGAKVAAKAPRHGLDSFEDKAEAVKAAAADPQGHMEALQRTVAGIMPHAPSVASAFVSAAFKAMQYLASVMPKTRPINPAMPNAGDIQPSAHEKMVFAKVFDAVDNPHRAIAEAASMGKWVPQEFAAAQATHPKLIDAYTRKLAEESIKATAPPKADRALLLSALTGKPATPAMMQQNIAMQQAIYPQKDGKADKGVAGQPGGGGTSAQSRGIPKAAKLSFASQTSLTPKQLAP